MKRLFGLMVCGVVMFALGCGEKKKTTTTTTDDGKKTTTTEEKTNK